jgi:hypothetical protein
MDQGQEPGSARGGREAEEDWAADAGRRDAKFDVPLCSRQRRRASTSGQKATSGMDIATVKSLSSPRSKTRNLRNGKCQ